jgi:GxxExxY protein
MQIQSSKKFDGKYADQTERIIAAFYQVYNQLGYGFLEKVYENALRVELENQHFLVMIQRPITVFYSGVNVGEYFADMVIDEVIVVEIKAVSEILEEHEAQLINYLKSTSYEVGLLLNFGQKPQFRRKVFDNDKKGNLSWLKS